MAITSTYDVVGAKEVIDDIIANVSPTDTPFQTSVGTQKVRNTVYQWQEDTLRAAASNAKAEGFTASSNTLTATTMRSNTTQIMSETVQVSGSMEELETYGRDDELAYQLSKAAKGLKKDFEYHLVGLVQAKVTGDDTVDGAGTPRKFANVPSMIGANCTVAGGTAALTEDMVLSLNQKLYTEGGEASIMMIKPADALVVANFAYKQITGTSTTNITTQAREREVTGDRILNVINFYKSPFGEQKFVLNRHQSTAHLFAFSPDSWKIMVYRPWQRVTLAKTGDNTSVMIVGEYGLKHRNYLMSGMINALT